MQDKPHENRQAFYGPITSNFNADHYCPISQANAYELVHLYFLTSEML